MYYIIQENTFREENYDNLVQAVERMDLPYEIVKVRPFTEDVDFITDRTDVFVFGSVKLARVGRRFGWNPGSLLNENHDYRVYSEKYGDRLLNADSRVVRFGDDFGWTAPEYFVRPCEDTKTFTGRVFDRHDWTEFRNRMLTAGHETTLCAETEIQVAAPKRILKEYRFWVVGGRVVTGSQYRLGGRVRYDDFVDPGAAEFCQESVDVFALADAFVMDIAMVDDGYRIVECGCINSAGFYRADMQRLICALEDTFGRRQDSPVLDYPPRP